MFFGRTGWRLNQIEKDIKKIMAALDDLKAADAAIGTAVQNVVTYLQNLATTISGGVSAADAEAIVTDLNKQAAALQAAIPAPTV